LRETTSSDVLIVKIGVGVLAVSWQKNQNKKLRYREGHSASVVLSWFT